MTHPLAYIGPGSDMQPAIGPLLLVAGFLLFLAPITGIALAALLGIGLRTAGRMLLRVGYAVADAC